MLNVGEYISALSNSAAYTGKVNAYLIWGIDNNTHEIIGTSFKPRQSKIGNQEMESWLLGHLKPKVDFYFYEYEIEGKSIVMLEIGAAFRHPVQFKNTEYIRVGSYKKKLKEYPEKEHELWRIFDRQPFEKEIAAENQTADQVLKLIDYPAYFDLLDLNLPNGKSKIIEALEADDIIKRTSSGAWNITNMGAILFAKSLSKFPALKRKAVRVILYKGNSKFETLKEQVGEKGYASGFEGLIGYIQNLVPSNEVIGKALRKTVPMFPELAIRELVANAIIHQDFHSYGASPMVEIFENRIEITNPGAPLVQTDRFLDSPPKSRNEGIASLMRRVGVCEERGSGIDKVVMQSEIFQLPAPLFEKLDEFTRVVLFAHKEFKYMDKKDKMRACYLHACLRYVQHDYMTNTSLRDRLGIETKNSAQVSRIIKDALDADLIRCYDDSVGNKARKYIPTWA